jgi:hypothetical protein
MFVNDTRRKTMTYNKPEVVKLDGAVKAIQSNQKGIDPEPDSTDPQVTVSAYESDE